MLHPCKRVTLIAGQRRIANVSVACNRPTTKKAFRWMVD